MVQRQLGLVLRPSYLFYLQQAPTYLLKKPTELLPSGIVKLRLSIPHVFLLLLLLLLHINLPSPPTYQPPFPSYISTTVLLLFSTLLPLPPLLPISFPHPSYPFAPPVTEMLRHAF